MKFEFKKPDTDKQDLSKMAEDFEFVSSFEPCFLDTQKMNIKKF